MTYPEFMAARQLLAEEHVGRAVRAAAAREAATERESLAHLRKRGQ